MPDPEPLHSRSIESGVNRLSGDQSIERLAMMKRHCGNRRGMVWENRQNLESVLAQADADKLPAVPIQTPFIETDFDGDLPARLCFCRFAGQLCHRFIILDNYDFFEPMNSVLHRLSGLGDPACASSGAEPGNLSEYEREQCRLQVHSKD